MPLANSGTAYHLGATPLKKLYAGAVQVWPQAPILTSISPTSMLHLSGAITLTATGNNFFAGCVLQIKLTSASTWTNMNASTVVSKTQMTGSVDMIPGNYTVRVIDAQGRVTAELPFQGLHDTPVLNSISPNTVHVVDAAMRLTVSGSKFYGAGSGFTGLTIYLLPPGGSWQAKTTVVTSATSAYADGVDPTVGGTWKVMVGYDGVNVTRSAQQNLTVNTNPLITSVTPATIGRGVSFDMVINGYGLGTTQMVTMGVHDFDGLGYWPDSVSDTEVRLNDFFFSIAGSQMGAYDIACRANEDFGPILASKVDALTVTD